MDPVYLEPIARLSFVGFRGEAQAFNVSRNRLWWADHARWPQLPDLLRISFFGD